MSDRAAVQRAVELIKAGRKADARDALKAVIAKDRDDPLAWAAMVQAVESRQEAIFCLKQVLRLKPGDAWATDRLRRLEGAAAPPSPNFKQVPPFLPASEPSSPPVAVPASGQQLVSAVQAGSLPGEKGGLPELIPLPTQPTPEEQAAASTIETARPDSPATIARGRAGATRSASMLVAGPLVIIAVLLLVAGVFVWYEFLAHHPHDEEKALQAAREWTEANFREDYDVMEGLVCGLYAPQVRQRRQESALVGIFIGMLGVDFSSEPPDTLTYELVSIKGNQARVLVDGFYPELEEFMGDSFSDEVTYTMKREFGDWKWCGPD
jgi:hypothetical protein